jgi:uncharacterized protein
MCEDGDYEWDGAKAAKNLAKHGVSFDSVTKFEWDSAIEREDDREGGGELRTVALGYIGVRLLLVYTWRDPRIRVISLRKAEKGEVNAYLKATAIRRG